MSEVNALVESSILVVDDIPANLRLLVKLLTERGYRVRAAVNGEAALTTVQTSPPDLILLDVMMPGLDGYEVCRRLKAEEQTKDIPVIFISSLDDVFDKVKAFSAGGVDYITKPFQVEEVTARVETHLALRQKNKALTQALQELKATQTQLIEVEKLAVMGKLAGGIAHELRSPLGVMVNAVYFLQAAQQESDKHIQEYHDIIMTKVQEAENLIEDLLSFAEPSEPVWTTIHLHELVTSVLSQHPPAAHLKLIVEINKKLPPVLVDQTQVERALTNLVINAYQAMPKEGQLTIQANMVTENTISLSLTDTGPGITAEMQKKIFEPLFTTQAKSIGLGLPVAQNLIRANRGHIDVQSKEGEGSTFSIILPTRTILS